MLTYRIENAERLRTQLDPKKVDQAKRWALNAVSRKAATYISRDIRHVFAVRAADVKAHLRITRYTRDSARALIYTGKSLPLEQFKPRTKRVAVTATSSRGTRFRTHRRATTVTIRRDKGVKPSAVCRKKAPAYSPGAVFMPRAGYSAAAMSCEQKTISAAANQSSAATARRSPAWSRTRTPLTAPRIWCAANLGNSSTTGWPTC